MKKTLIAALAIGALALPPAIFAQGEFGPGPGPGPDAGAGGGPRMLPPEIELPEEIAAIRDDLVALRESLAASRREVLDALGPDATREDRAAALEEWRTVHEDEIADVRELGQELRDALEELGIGGGRSPIEIPPEISEARDEMHALAQSLGDSRRAVIDALGEDATVEERRTAIEAWRVEHAADLAELAALREQIGTWLRENRPDRGQRPGMASNVRDRVRAFREDAQEMRQARRQLRDRLAAASTEEERREIIRQFRERYRDLMQERRELKRLERLAGNGVGGDRRPGG